MKKLTSTLLMTILVLSLIACTNEPISSAQDVETEIAAPAEPQAEEIVAREAENRDTLSDEELAAIAEEAAAVGGGRQIPAGKHNGVSADNVITPIMQDLFTMPAKECYLFMKDGAIHSDTNISAAEILMKPYSLGTSDGLLYVMFHGPMDTAVTADNAIKPSDMSFFYRGATESQFNQVKVALEEYGIESWYGEDFPAWNALAPNSEYCWNGAFEYNGKTYDVALSILTEQDEPYYIESFENALGTGWPQLSVYINCYE